MTSAQLGALTRALAYLIKETPVPKSASAKADRTALLKDLLNAARPTNDERTPPPDPSPRMHAANQPRETSTTAPAAESSPVGPLVIGVEIVSPNTQPIAVRPGTTAGTPRAISTPDHEPS